MPKRQISIAEMRNTTWFRLLTFPLIFLCLSSALNAQNPSVETKDSLLISDGSVYEAKDFYPKFSWDITPMYFMFGNNTTLQPEEVNVIVAKTDFICLEKNHGKGDFGYAELGTKHEIAEFKAIKPDLKSLFYFNSAYAYPFTSYTENFTQAKIVNYPELKAFLIVNQETGLLENRNNVFYFDVLNPDFRKWWVESVVNGVEVSGADGVFIDQMHGFVWLRPTLKAEVEAAQGELMADLKLKLGPDKILLGNNAADVEQVFPSVDAVMFEHYAEVVLTKEKLLDDWNDMLRIAKAGKMSIYRFGMAGEIQPETAAGFEQLSKERLDFYLSCYLIGAQPYSYFQYGWGWQLYDGSLVDYPTLQKPLGSPLGAYNRTSPDRWEFTRLFENASVKVDLETRTGEITWVGSPDNEYKPISNLAMSGTATQSSIDFGGEATRANDGNTNGAYSGASVTHTLNEVKPWWQVDLGSSCKIGEISVFGRTDVCCKARLTDFNVYVLDADSTVIYSNTFADYPDPSVTLNAGGLDGKYVIVQMNGTGTLSLAEVKVFEVQVPKHEGQYTVSLKITDDITNDSITIASLDINDKTYTSNYVGELTLKLDEGTYPFTLSKEGYNTLYHSLNISMDTALVIQMSAIPIYTLSYKITDDSTNVVLSEVLLAINDHIYTSDNLGEISLTLFEGEYDYALSKAGFYSKNQSIHLTQDTVVALQMDKESHSLGFQIKDAKTKENLPDVSITLDDAEYQTDSQGNLSLIHDYGEYDYTISKTGYHSINQSIFLTSDTVVGLQMDIETYTLVIQVKDAATDEVMPSVLISINDSVYETDALGSHSLVLDYGDYVYALNKEAYVGDSGSLSLLKDTTLTILMSLVTSVNSLYANMIKMYPNPAHSKLFIESDEIIQRFEICDLRGSLLFRKEMNGNNTSIDITAFQNGIYIARIYRDEIRTVSLKLIKSE